MSSENEEPLSRPERVYSPLGDYLRTVSAEEDAVLSFVDVEALIGRSLPPAARANEAWWGSIPRQPQSRAWLRADRRASVDLTAETVTFVFEVFSRGLDLEQLKRTRSYWLAHARDALVDIDYYGNAERGWWEPHVVYLIHYPAESVFKVGLTRVGTNRISKLTGSRGRLVDQLSVANRWAALVVEHHVLELVWDAWKPPARFASGERGETEQWADWLVPPPLSAVCDSLVEDRQAPGWDVSVYRDDS